MDKKERIYQNLICTACLCVDRNLQRITDVKLKQYYFDILNEIPIYSSCELEPNICWECEALLKRAVYFREQVKDCFYILQTYNNENISEHVVTDVSRPPRLSIFSNAPVIVSPDDEEETVLCKDENGLEVVDVKLEFSNARCSDDVKEESSNSDPDNQYESEYSEELLKLEEEVKEYIKKERDGSRNKKGRKSTDNQVENSKDIVKLEEVHVYMERERDKGRKRKKSKNSKEKKSKKIVKSLIKGKQATSKSANIRTIELSYEEMVSERARLAASAVYLGSEHRCEHCLLGFSYYDTYTDHMNNKHDQSLGDYTCPICKTVISSVESFTAHYKRHLRRYECLSCGKRTMDRKVMTYHYESAHNGNVKEYKCNICGKLSNTIDAHRYHKDTHKKRAECSECHKTFSHRAGLINHTLTVHKNKCKFPCTACDKVFRWKTSLKKHMEKHEDKSQSADSLPYCEPCGVSFSSVCSYQRHMRNSLKHVTENELKYICADCNRKFANKTKLRDHIEEKHLLKTYHCKICFKPSKNRVCLDQHIRNVHKGRPKNKICHHCGKGFPTKVQLESHIRSHTGEKPFICEYCPTTFSQQSNLYKHNRQVTSYYCD